MADEKESPVTSKIHDLIGRLKEDNADRPLKPIVEALMQANEEERTGDSNAYLPKDSA